MKLTEFEFKVLQSLSNMVWIQNHIRKKCEDVNQKYLLKKLRTEEFEPEPVYLVNQFDSHNIQTLWRFINNIKHEKTKNKLIKFFVECTGSKGSLISTLQ